MEPLRLREAGPSDADAVAALHLASWRSAYRGILADAWLDGPAEADRLTLWRARLAEDPAARIVLVAEAAGALAGFACLERRADGPWGLLVDNLHARPDMRGRGIGRLLLRELAARVPDDPVHLWVLEANAPARGFYARVGGRAVERVLHREPDGGDHPVLRIAWASGRALREGVDGG
jgi:ribosomal protein S18 acetylase RimI-like enzyme